VVLILVVIPLVLAPLVVVPLVVVPLVLVLLIVVLRRLYVSSYCVTSTFLFNVGHFCLTITSNIVSVTHIIV
jgi:hypothetical protein